MLRLLRQCGWRHGRGNGGAGRWDRRFRRGRWRFGDAWRRFNRGRRLRGHGIACMRRSGRRWDDGSGCGNNRRRIRGWSSYWSGRFSRRGRWGCWSDGCGKPGRRGWILQIDRRLHAGFMTGRDYDAVEAAAAEFGAFGFERVFAGLERGKAIGAVFPRGGAQLPAGSHVAQDHADTGERRGMKVGQAAGKRAGLRGRRLALERRRRGEKQHRRAQRRYGEDANPAPLLRSHLQPASHAERENMRPCAPGARPRRCL